MAVVHDPRTADSIAGGSWELEGAPEISSPAILNLFAELGPTSGSRVIDALRELAAREPLKLRVRGECMAPVLREGDCVEVSGARRYWPGDILVFLSLDGRLLSHRLIGYRPRGWKWELVTIADAAPAPDAPVSLERVIGRISAGDAVGVRVSLLGRLRALARFTRLVLEWGWRRVRRWIADALR